MNARILITVTSGERRLAVELADHAVTVLEAPDDWQPLRTSAGVVQALLPVAPGAAFAITAQVHHGERSP